MQKLFEILIERIKQNKPSVLVTVIEGKGSVPRSSGAYMIADDKGRIYGTVGGGNIEYRATAKAKAIIDKKQNCVYEYNLSNDRASELGMVCGGSAKILFYYIDEESGDIIEKALEMYNKRKAFWLLLPLKFGKIGISENIKSNKHKFITNDNYYAEEFLYDGRVYIFGGGHLAKEVIPLLSHLEFRCIVMDDRDDFADKALFPQAEEVIKSDLSNINLSINKSDYIIIMTRGHLFDTDVLRFALNTTAKYIGVVGSRKKAQIVREKLKNEGFSDNELNRIITPIGIDIGSETPAEIAISIAAQLIKIRNENREEKI